MAAFAIFSNSNEKTTASYKQFIERVQQRIKLEVGDKPLVVSASSFKYYSAHKDKKGQHAYKDYIYHLNMKMLDGGAGIMICENPTPTFEYFIRLIDNLELPDGINANAYYGDMKYIITGFMNYFTSVIDETGKRINKHTHFLCNKLFVELIDDTIAIYETNHASFLKQYLPLNSEVEKDRYQQVIDGQAKFLAELRQIRDVWEFRLDKLEIFVKKNLEASIQKISDLCNFTHCYISMMLADRLYEIAVSIEATATRLKCNLQKYNEGCTRNKHTLIDNLYDKNKEQLEIYRRLNQRSVDTAEVNRTMELIKEKMDHCGNDETFARLQFENLYWSTRLRDFNEIASVLIKIQSELESLDENQKKYKNISFLELPGKKTVCFEKIGENIDVRISYLQKKYLEMSRALITFFYVRGTDRVLYTDRAGSFYVDEFNHQNYITNYGLKYFHVNCYGEFVENSQSTPYYFDDNGRYTLDENGEKIYQVATCTSQYKLGEDSLYKKVTKDCGHSNIPNPNCRLEEIKDPTDKEILPKNNPIDITGTLDKDSVKFLWESYGMILPEVLCQVATKQPKNPIHAMARLLIKRKFEASTAELRNMKKNAQKYRNDIQTERKNKAIAERRAWKAKLMKRHKAEHYDDYQERSGYQQFYDHLFAESMGYYE